MKLFGENVAKHHIGLLLYVCLWASRNVFTATLLQKVDPVVFTFFIAVFAVGYSMLLRAVRHGYQINYSLKETFPSFLILGIATSVALVGMNIALSLLSPVLYSLIDVSLYPILASVIAYLFAKEETLQVHVLLPILSLATIGIVLFSIPSFIDTQVKYTLLGLILTLLAELGWAISITAVANLVRSGTYVLDIIGFRFLITVFALGILILLGKQVFVVSDVYEIAIVALLGFVVPFLLSFSSLKHLSVTTFAIYTTLTPIVTYLIAGLILGEWHLSLLQVIGALFVFTSILLRILSEYHYRKQESPVTID